MLQDTSALVSRDDGGGGGGVGESNYNKGAEAGYIEEAEEKLANLTLAKGALAAGNGVDRVLQEHSTARQGGHGCCLRGRDCADDMLVPGK